MDEATPGRISQDLVRLVERKVVLRGITATFATLIPLTIASRLAARDVVLPSSAPAFEWLSLIVIPVMSGCAMLVFAVAVHRFIRGNTTWLREGRTPTVPEQRAVTKMALPMTLFIAPLWVAGAVIFILVSTTVLRFTNAVMVPLGFIGIAIAGLVDVAFTYVLVDDALPPLYALALDDQQIRPERALGLLPRFGLYWLVGSGLNLFSIALVLIALPDAGRRIALVFCGFGTFVGGGLTILAARSVTGRVERLLTDVQRVEGGDLTTAADVDDPGEIGRLQRGFNRMVAGLRERERVSDLFGRHVGADVARRALKGTGLEGSELNVSVLFIDVIGSTTLASDRPPRDVVAMLNGLFDSVVRVVGAEGGLVNQFQGDGALCVFGAPLEDPDHAGRALRTARVLAQDLASLRLAFPGFDAAIGVSTGNVVAGDIGNEDRYQYTVIGDPVNEAARLCDEAKRRERRVLVSGSTIESASAEGWIAGGEVQLRGRAQPTPVFEPA